MRKLEKQNIKRFHYKEWTQYLSSLVTASFGQALTLTGTSFYENYFGRDDDLTNRTLDFAGDMLSYAIGMSWVIGQNLSNSTMLAGAGKMIDDVKNLFRHTE